MLLVTGCGAASLVAAALRLTLGALLVTAAVLKLSQQSGLPLYDLIGHSSPRFSLAAQRALVATEALVGVWLILGWWATGAVIAGTVLIAVLTLAITVLLRRGYTGNCGCFGMIDNRPLGAAHILRNGALLLGSIFILSETYPASCVQLAPWELPTPALLLAIVLLAFVLLTYALLSEVVVLLSNERGAFKSESTLHHD